MNLASPKKRNWLVLGSGISGIGAALFLKSRGADVVVSDHTEPSLDIANQLSAKGIALTIGPQDSETLKGFTDLIVSPGISPRTPIVADAIARGLRVQTEIELALSEFRGTVVGITGTNGKSTTCVMTTHLLKESGLLASAGGNIGEPPSLLLAENRINDHLVLELSSYQLEYACAVKPRVAIFTSFSHDHLERHGTLDGYFKAKWNLVASMEPGSLFITKVDILERSKALGLTIPEGVRVATISDNNENILLAPPPYKIHNGLLVAPDGSATSLAPAQLESPHNQLNAAFSLLAVSDLTSLPLPSLVPRLRGFTSLPYRCQEVGLAFGFPIINDSKSTNVESTLIALDAFRQPCHLLIGGRGKGESYGPLKERSKIIKSCICFGESANLARMELSDTLKCLSFDTLRAAMNSLPTIVAADPALILFSPAGSSFDEFSNFEDRGAYFSRRAKEIFTH